MSPVELSFEEPVMVEGKTGEREWQRKTDKLTLRLRKPVTITTEGVKTEIVYTKGYDPEEPPGYRSYDSVDISHCLASSHLPEIDTKDRKPFSRELEPPRVAHKVLLSASENPRSEPCGKLANGVSFRIRWLEKRRA